MLWKALAVITSFLIAGAISLRAALGAVLHLTMSAVTGCCAVRRSITVLKLAASSAFRGDRELAHFTSRLEVSKMLARLQVGDAHHPGRREAGAEDELVFLQVTILQGDFANLELHAARRQVTHERRELLIVGRLGAFHQKIHAFSVRDGDDLRFRIDIEMIPDVAQALGGLGDAGVEVVDHFVLRARAEAGEGKDGCGNNANENSHEEFSRKMPRVAGGVGGAYW